MKAMKQEPTTKLLSEMEGIPGVWDEEKNSRGIRIQRNSIPDYATEDFWEAIGLWSDWKMFGFPEVGGSNDQGGLYMDILRAMQTFDAEYCNVES